MEVIQREILQSSDQSQPRIDQKLPRANTEPHRREVRISILENERSKMQTEIIELREENKHLIEERDCLLNDFEECKTQLLKWQAPVQISDDSLQRNLEKTHRAIDDWVYDAIVDAEDNFLYELSLKEHQRLQKQQHCTEFEGFIKNSPVHTWGPYLCSNFFILSLIVQWILDELVFRREYPLALAPSQAQALREIEEAMRNSSQYRGSLSVDRWKSETLRALTTSSNNKVYHAESLEDISEQAKILLLRWVLDSRVFARLEEQFQQDILEPAIHLLEDIRSSNYRYRMDEDDVLKGLSSQQMLDQWDLKDVDTWGPVRKGSQELKKLRCLHPPLIRIRNSDEIPIVLSKPVIIVSVLHPGKLSQANAHSGSETSHATSDSKSSEIQSKQTLTQQTIREEEAMETSSLSGTSDLEIARRSRGFKQRRSRRQSSDTDLISSHAKRIETRRSSPAKGITVDRTVSPDTYYQMAPRDTAHQQGESRFSREHEDSYLHSRRVPAAEEGLCNRNIPIVRPYFIEERQPEEARATTVLHKDAKGATSPGNGRRASAATVRHTRRETSRSREKRSSIAAGETFTNPNVNPALAVPPANSNLGVWSVVKRAVNTSGPWRSPPAR